MKSIAFVILLSLLVASCSMTSLRDSPASRNSGRMVSAAATQFCLVRKDTAAKRDWIILPRPVDAYASSPGFSYDIGYSTDSGTESPIQIMKGDRFELVLDQSGERVELSQNRNVNGSEVLVGSASLERESSNMAPDLPLWLYGNALDQSGAAIGTYYVYALDDKIKCRKKLTVNGCKSLHFEFFVSGDRPDERPDEPDVVVPYISNSCSIPKREPRETSEGDGDHGPNH
jgi:hypothetical protein